MIATGDATRPMGLRSLLPLAILLLVTLAWFCWREFAQRTQGQMIEVVTAGVDLPAGKTVSAGDLVTTSLPRRFVPPLAILQPREVLGQVTLTPLVAGEVVTRTRVAPAASARRLAAVVPSGQRAVTIPMGAVRGGAQLRPQDRVDVIGSFEFGEAKLRQGYVMTLLRDLPILAVNRVIGAEVPGAGATASHGLPNGDGTLTVAVSPEAAQRLIFALEHGSVYLSLHATADAADDGPPPAPATAAQVTGLTSLIPRQDYRGRR